MQDSAHDCDFLLERRWQADFSGGVFKGDIQPIAVDISKLRFFLSLIVDEKVNDDKENRGIEPLPNLEFKFVCANSLIGLPKGETKQEKKQDTFFKASSEIVLLKNLRDEYLRSYGKEKALIEKKFKETQSRMFRHSLNWGGKDSQTLKLSQWDPFSFESCGWFNPEWMFGICNSSPFEKGGEEGFDIVIANPPYVQLQKDGGRLANLYKNCGYQTFERTGDIYTLFYENGINILKAGGHLCFITSNKWMRVGYGKSLRKYFNAYNPRLLIDLGPGIFESATVDTNILIIEKKKNQGQLAGLTLNAEARDKDLSDFISNNKNILPKMGDDAWFIGSDAEQKLKEKIKRIGKPLEEKAKKRDDQGQNWWNLRACAYYPEFEKEKVMWAEMSKSPSFSYDNNLMYCNDTGRISPTFAIRT